jgi:hypothetical protein
VGGVRPLENEFAVSHMHSVVKHNASAIAIMLTLVSHYLICLTCQLAEALLPAELGAYIT